MGKNRPSTKLLKGILMLYLEKVPDLKELWDRLDKLPSGHPDLRYNSIVNRIRTIVAQKQRKKNDEEKAIVNNDVEYLCMIVKVHEQID